MGGKEEQRVGQIRNKVEGRKLKEEETSSPDSERLSDIVSVLPAQDTG